MYDHRTRRRTSCTKNAVRYVRGMALLNLIDKRAGY
jgi:hypothetical protein